MYSDIEKDGRIIIIITQLQIRKQWISQAPLPWKER